MIRRDDAVEPAGAFAARRALAARLGVVEARDALEHAHHAGGLVHHDHGRRADRRARRLLERSRSPCSPSSSCSPGTTGTDAPPGDHGLELAAAAHAAADLEQVLERDAERQLEVARLVRRGRRSRRSSVPPEFCGAETGEPLRAACRRIVGTEAKLCALLIVVGLPYEAEVRWERRLEARLARLAFERLEQRRFPRRRCRRRRRRSVYRSKSTPEPEHGSCRAGPRVVGFLAAPPRSAARAPSRNSPRM